MEQACICCCGPDSFRFPPQPCQNRQRCDMIKSSISFKVWIMSLTSALGYGSLFSETSVQSVFIMVLCTFIGFWSACRVNSAFHAPLMGLTNAMSSMILFLAVTFYGALSGSGFLRTLTTITIFFLAMNLTGGLFITQRMLSLFSNKNKPE
jgi:NAD(P) transhydrogenase subunit alpha